MFTILVHNIVNTYKYPRWVLWSVRSLFCIGIPWLVVMCRSLGQRDWTISMLRARCLQHVRPGPYIQTVTMLGPVLFTHHLRHAARSLYTPARLPAGKHEHRPVRFLSGRVHASQMSWSLNRKHVYLCLSYFYYILITSCGILVTQSMYLYGLDVNSY